MRRGPGGGLVVTVPTVESVMEAVAVYLFYVGAEVSEVFEARLVLEEVVAELAPSRLAEDDVEALRELVARVREGGVHSAEARRVGEECGSTGRSGWSPRH